MQKGAYLSLCTWCCSFDIYLLTLPNHTCLIHQCRSVTKQMIERETNMASLDWGIKALFRHIYILIVNLWWITASVLFNSLLSLSLALALATTTTTKNLKTLYGANYAASLYKHSRSTESFPWMWDWDEGLRGRKRKKLLLMRHRALAELENWVFVFFFLSVFVPSSRLDGDGGMECYWLTMPTTTIMMRGKNRERENLKSDNPFAAAIDCNYSSEFGKQARRTVAELTHHPPAHYSTITYIIISGSIGTSK